MSKPSIQLPVVDRQENITTSARPKLKSKSSSSWSIPCCTHISLGRQSSGRIQLPEDSDTEAYSDEDEDDGETFDPSPVARDDRQEEESNVFLQRQTASSHNILSHNPFARATTSSSQEELRQKQAVNTADEAVKQENEFVGQTSGERELASFSRASFTRYEDEPDWTDDFENQEQEEMRAGQSREIKGFDIINQDEEEQEEGQLVANIPDNNNTTATPTAKNEDRIPQIEKEIFHLLPLPQLSKEIPPSLIHKQTAFEKSMYGEQPLMSTSVKPTRSTSRISRFSMSEEDYAALKKAEHQRKRASTLALVSEDEQKKVQVVAKEESSHPNIQTPIDEHKQKNREPSVTNVINEPTEAKDDRRSSMAQSLLGDRLDDFTEKLAFIKKNIIMNIDSDEEEEEEDINAEAVLKRIEDSKLKNTSRHSSQDDISGVPPTLHRRASSLMDVGPTLARFINHIGGANQAPGDTSNAQLSSSQNSVSSFSPSSLFSALAGPMPESTSHNTRKEVSDPKKIIQEEEEEEDLFDFTKVIEIGKNVKTFSEGFVGNGIRMFNDVAIRVKTTVEEEQKKAAAQLAAQKTESTSTTFSDNNENEWMHNYL